ncbi:hypothetical protein B0H19DRAFT_1138696 [Mycena capillaripes]|nr:hypothetical protein B0H19DRAFT_1138696 [Mycena capillaripes]
MALCPLRWECRSRCLLLCLGLCSQVSLNTTINYILAGYQGRTKGTDVIIVISGDALERDTTCTCILAQGHFCDKRLIVLETLSPTLLQ